MYKAPGSTSPRGVSAVRSTRVSGGLICALALVFSFGPAFAGRAVAGDTAVHTTTANDEIAPLGVACPALIPGVNVYIDFRGTTSGCTEPQGICQAGEAVAFRAASFGYSFACTTHAFSWSFGDGITASAEAASHVFASAGFYTVKLAITNAQQTVTLAQNVLVANPASRRRRAIVPPTANGNQFPHPIAASGGMIVLPPSGAAPRGNDVLAEDAAARALDSAIAMRVAAELLSQREASLTPVIFVEGDDPGDGEMLEIVATIVETYLPGSSMRYRAMPEHVGLD